MENEKDVERDSRNTDENPDKLRTPDSPEEAGELSPSETGSNGDQPVYPEKTAGAGVPKSV